MYISFNDHNGRATIAKMISINCECLKADSEPQYRMLINDGKETHIVIFPSAENLKSAAFKLRDAIIAKEPYISLCDLELKT